MTHGGAYWIIYVDATLSAPACCCDTVMPPGDTLTGQVCFRATLFCFHGGLYCSGENLPECLPDQYGGDIAASQQRAEAVKRHRGPIATPHPPADDPTRSKKLHSGFNVRDDEPKH